MSSTMLERPEITELISGFLRTEVNRNAYIGSRLLGICATFGGKPGITRNSVDHFCLAEAVGPEALFLRNTQ